MALLKEVTTAYGSIAKYWRLTKIHIDYAQRIGYAVLSPYLSQEDRENDKMSLPQADVRVNFNVENFNNYLSPEALAQNNKTMYEAIFDYAKTLEVFQNATDA